MRNAQYSKGQKQIKSTGNWKPMGGMEITRRKINWVRIEILTRSIARKIREHREIWPWGYRNIQFVKEVKLLGYQIGMGKNSKRSGKHKLKRKRSMWRHQEKNLQRQRNNAQKMELTESGKWAYPKIRPVENAPTS